MKFDEIPNIMVKQANDFFGGLDHWQGTSVGKEGLFLQTSAE